MEGNASLSSTSSIVNGNDHGGGDYVQLVMADQGRRHNFPVIDREWTDEELDILKDGLKRLALILQFFFWKTKLLSMFDQFN